MKNLKQLPIHEAAKECGLNAELIVRFISFQWIVPADAQQTMLDEEDITRARLIWQLQNDFGVNDAAMPIILHLVDQLNRTHVELKDYFAE